MSNLSIIREKRQSLADKIAAREEELARLQKELADFEAAERVLISIGEDNSRAHERLANGTPSPSIRPSDGRKPRGLPTVPEMIIKALEAALNNGQQGLSSPEILAYVRQNIWQDARPNDVISTAWRMWKHDKLRKDGKIYNLPHHHRRDVLGK